MIILGDLDSSFLLPAAQASLEKFVLDGGGLLMLGGQNSFGPGKYKGTPVERALPVLVGEITAAQETTQFVPRLTAEGAAHAAMEGLVDWLGVDQTAPTKTLPPLRGNVVVAGKKDGATVLAVHADRPGPDGNPQIVLAVQRYGNGRSAAFTADTTNLWYNAMRASGQDSPFNRFWGQLVRWLAGADVRNRQRGAGVDGLLNKSWYQHGESVRVRAIVRDERGDVTELAQVNVRYKRAGETEWQQMPLSAASARRGLYEATLPSPEKGDYVVELTATIEGKPLGKQDMRFTVIPPADEMLKVAANPALLTAVATQTRGYAYELAELPKLLEKLIQTDPHAATARQETVPLANTLRVALALSGRKVKWDERYDLPMQGALVVCLLSAEWLLRRRWQLP